MRSCLATCLLSVLLSPVLEAASSSEQLGPRDKEILDRVSLAWFQGDPRTALEQLSPLVNRLKCSESFTSYWVFHCAGPL